MNADRTASAALDGPDAVEVGAEVVVEGSAASATGTRTVGRTCSTVPAATGDEAWAAPTEVVVATTEAVGTSCSIVATGKASNCPSRLDEPPPTMAVTTWVATAEVVEVAGPVVVVVVVVVVAVVVDPELRLSTSCWARVSSDCSMAASKAARLLRGTTRPPGPWATRSASTALV